MFRDRNVLTGAGRTCRVADVNNQTGSPSHRWINQPGVAVTFYLASRHPQPRFRSSSLKQTGKSVKKKLKNTFRGKLVLDV